MNELRERPARDPVSSFIRGAFSPIESLGLLAKHRALWPFAAAPFLLSFVLLAGLITGAAFAVYHWGWESLGAPPEDAGVWTFLRWLFTVTVLIIAAFLGMFVFRAIVLIVAAPFHDFLSEKVERVLLGKTIEEPFSWKRLLADLARPIFDVIKLLAYQLILLVIFLPLLLVPVVGGLLYSAILCYIAAMDYLDIPMARYRMSLGQKRALLRRNRSEVLGLGITSTLALLVPIVNFMIIPIGVIAGTITYHRLREGDPDSVTAP
ncbi:MAG: EI24 domain-containing protein [Planctomycetota bacterium]